MGRLSPFEIPLSIALLVFTLLTPNEAAPVQDSAQDSLASERGCYYNATHYPNGRPINTTNPCLNCECMDNSLMCFLRICPFVKPLDNRFCKTEHHEGECCPRFWCKEEYKPPTEEPHTAFRGCHVDGYHFEEGARIPMDPKNPCEACYCIRNASVCTLQTCKLDIDGCFPEFREGSCCPSRYNCSDEAITTVPPGIMEEDEYEGCKEGNILYKDGDQIPSEDKCQSCYCMRHTKVCSIAKCEPPAPNCKPLETHEGECCASKYECPEGTEIPDTAFVHMVTTEADLLKPSTAKPEELSTTKDEEASSEAESESSTESMLSTTKGLRRIDDIDSTTATSQLSYDSVKGIVRVKGQTMRTEEPRPTPTTPRITRPKFEKKVPGEGNCWDGTKTIPHGQRFESSDPCLQNCTCISTELICDRMECVMKRLQPGCRYGMNRHECCPYVVCESSTTEQEPVKVTTEKVIVTFDSSTTSEIVPGAAVTHELEKGTTEKYPSTEEITDLSKTTEIYTSDEKAPSTTDGTKISTQAESDQTSYSGKPDTTTEHVETIPASEGSVQDFSRTSTSEPLPEEAKTTTEMDSETQTPLTMKPITKPTHELETIYKLNVTSETGEVTEELTTTATSDVTGERTTHGVETSETKLTTKPVEETSAPRVSISTESSTAESITEATKESIPDHKTEAFLTDTYGVTSTEATPTVEDKDIIIATTLLDAEAEGDGVVTEKPPPKKQSSDVAPDDIRDFLAPVETETELYEKEGPKTVSVLESEETAATEPTLEISELSTTKATESPDIKIDLTTKVPDVSTTLLEEDETTTSKEETTAEKDLTKEIELSKETTDASSFEISKPVSSTTEKYIIEEKYTPSTEAEPTSTAEASSVTSTLPSKASTTDVLVSDQFETEIESKHLSTTEPSIDDEVLTTSSSDAKGEISDIHKVTTVESETTRPKMDVGTAETSTTSKESAITEIPAVTEKEPITIAKGTEKETSFKEPDVTQTADIVRTSSTTKEDVTTSTEVDGLEKETTTKEYVTFSTGTDGLEKDATTKVESAFTDTKALKKESTPSTSTIEMVSIESEERITTSVYTEKTGASEISVADVTLTETVKTVELSTTEKPDTVFTTKESEYDIVTLGIEETKSTVKPSEVSEEFASTPGVTDGDFLETKKPASPLSAEWTTLETVIKTTSKPSVDVEESLSTRIGTVKDDETTLATTVFDSSITSVGVEKESEPAEGIDSRKKPAESVTETLKSSEVPETVSTHGLTEETSVPQTISSTEKSTPGLYVTKTKEDVTASTGAEASSTSTTPSKLTTAMVSLEGEELITTSTLTVKTETGEVSVDGVAPTETVEAEEVSITEKPKSDVDFTSKESQFDVSTHSTKETISTKSDIVTEEYVSTPSATDGDFLETKKPAPPLGVEWTTLEIVNETSSKPSVYVEESLSTKTTDIIKEKETTQASTSLDYSSGEVEKESEPEESIDSRKKPGESEPTESVTQTTKSRETPVSTLGLTKETLFTHETDSSTEKTTSGPDVTKTTIKSESETLPAFTATQLSSEEPTKSETYFGITTIADFTKDIVESISKFFTTTEKQPEMVTVSFDSEETDRIATSTQQTIVSTEVLLTNLTDVPESLLKDISKSTTVGEIETDAMLSTKKDEIRTPTVVTETLEGISVSTLASEDVSTGAPTTSESTKASVYEVTVSKDLTEALFDEGTSLSVSKTEVTDEDSVKSISSKETDIYTTLNFTDQEHEEKGKLTTEIIFTTERAVSITEEAIYGEKTQETIKIESPEKDAVAFTEAKATSTEVTVEPISTITTQTVTAIITEKPLEPETSSEVYEKRTLDPMSLNVTLKVVGTSEPPSEISVSEIPTTKETPKVTETTEIIKSTTEESSTEVSRIETLKPSDVITSSKDAETTDKIQIYGAPELITLSDVESLKTTSETIVPAEVETTSGITLKIDEERPATQSTVSQAVTTGVTDKITIPERTVSYIVTEETSEQESEPDSLHDGKISTQDAVSEKVTSIDYQTITLSTISDDQQDIQDKNITKDVIKTTTYPPETVEDITEATSLIIEFKGTTLHVSVKESDNITSVSTADSAATEKLSTEKSIISDILTTEMDSEGVTSTEETSETDIGGDGKLIDISTITFLPPSTLNITKDSELTSEIPTTKSPQTTYAEISYEPSTLVSGKLETFAQTGIPPVTDLVFEGQKSTVEQKEFTTIPGDSDLEKFTFSNVTVASGLPTKDLETPTATDTYESTQSEDGTPSSEIIATFTKMATAKEKVTDESSTDALDSITTASPISLKTEKSEATKEKQDQATETIEMTSSTRPVSETEGTTSLQSETSPEVFDVESSTATVIAVDITEPEKNITDIGKVTSMVSEEDLTTVKKYTPAVDIPDIKIETIKPTTKRVTDTSSDVTSSAETSTLSTLTDHTVITEKALVSNATFAIDARMRPTSPVYLEPAETESSETKAETSTESESTSITSSIEESTLSKFFSKEATASTPEEARESSKAQIFELSSTKQITETKTPFTPSEKETVSSKITTVKAEPEIVTTYYTDTELEGRYLSTTPSSILSEKEVSFVQKDLTSTSEKPEIETTEKELESSATSVDLKSTEKYFDLSRPDSESTETPKEGSTFPSAEEMTTLESEKTSAEQEFKQTTSDIELPATKMTVSTTRESLLLTEEKLLTDFKKDGLDTDSTPESMILGRKPNDTEADISSVKPIIETTTKQEIIDLGTEGSTFASTEVSEPVSRETADALSAETVTTYSASTEIAESTQRPVTDTREPDAYTSSISDERRTTDMLSTEKSLVTESTSSTATTAAADTTEAVRTSSAIVVTTDAAIEESAETEEERTTEDAATKEPGICVYNGTSYASGQVIASVDPCEKCKCAEGKTECLRITCRLPKIGCVPLNNRTTGCCPSAFICPSDDSMNMTITDEETTIKGFTTPIPISFLFSTASSSVASTLLVTKTEEFDLATGDFTKPTESKVSIKVGTIVPPATLASTSEEETFATESGTKGDKLTTKLVTIEDVTRETSDETKAAGLSTVSGTIFESEDTEPTKETMFTLTSVETIPTEQVSEKTSIEEVESVTEGVTQESVRTESEKPADIEYKVKATIQTEESTPAEAATESETHSTTKKISEDGVKEAEKTTVSEAETSEVSATTESTSGEVSKTDLTTETQEFETVTVDLEGKVSSTVLEREPSTASATISSESTTLPTDIPGFKLPVGIIAEKDTIYDAKVPSVKPTTTKDETENVTPSSTVIAETEKPIFLIKGITEEEQKLPTVETEIPEVRPSDGTTGMIKITAETSEGLETTGPVEITSTVTPLSVTEETSQKSTHSAESETEETLAAKSVTVDIPKGTETTSAEIVSELSSLAAEKEDSTKSTLADKYPSTLKEKVTEVFKETTMSISQSTIKGATVEGDFGTEAGTSTYVTGSTAIPSFEAETTATPESSTEHTVFTTEEVDKTSVPKVISPIETEVTSERTVMSTTHSEVTEKPTSEDISASDKTTTFTTFDLPENLTSEVKLFTYVEPISEESDTVKEKEITYEVTKQPTETPTTFDTTKTTVALTQKDVDLETTLEPESTVSPKSEEAVTTLEPKTVASELAKAPVAGDFSTKSSPYETTSVGSTLSEVLKTKTELIEEKLKITETLEDIIKTSEFPGTETSSFKPVTSETTTEEETSAATSSSTVSKEDETTAKEKVTPPIYSGLTESEADISTTSKLLPSTLKETTQKIDFTSTDKPQTILSELTKTATADLSTKSSLFETTSPELITMFSKVPKMETESTIEPKSITAETVEDVTKLEFPETEATSFKPVTSGTTIKEDITAATSLSTASKGDETTVREKITPPIYSGLTESETEISTTSKLLSSTLKETTTEISVTSTLKPQTDALEFTKETVVTDLSTKSSLSETISTDSTTIVLSKVSEMETESTIEAKSETTQTIEPEAVVSTTGKTLITLTETTEKHDVTSTDKPKAVSLELAKAPVPVDLSTKSSTYEATSTTPTILSKVPKMETESTEGFSKTTQALEDLTKKAEVAETEAPDTEPVTSETTTKADTTAVKPLTTVIRGEESTVGDKIASTIQSGPTEFDAEVSTTSKQPPSTLKETTEKTDVTSTFKPMSTTKSVSDVQEITKLISETEESLFTPEKTGFSTVPDAGTTFREVYRKETGIVPEISTTKRPSTVTSTLAASKDTEEQTDFEVITEIVDSNKTMTILGREITTPSPAKDDTSSTYIPAEVLKDTSTTDVTGKMEDVTDTAITSVTDKIFSFVSTRFAEVMKDIVGLTTNETGKEVTPHSELVTERTFGLLTEKESRVTTMVPLTRRIDMDLETSTAHTEVSKLTTEQPEEHRSTEKSYTEEIEVINITDAKPAQTDTVATGDILTTIASIMTSEVSTELESQIDLTAGTSKADEIVVLGERVSIEQKTSTLEPEVKTTTLSTAPKLITDEVKTSKMDATTLYAETSRVTSTSEKTKGTEEGKTSTVSGDESKIFADTQTELTPKEGESIIQGRGRQTTEVIERTSTPSELVESERVTKLESVTETIQTPKFSTISDFVTATKGMRKDMELESTLETKSDVTTETKETKLTEKTTLTPGFTEKITTPSTSAFEKTTLTTTLGYERKHVTESPIDVSTVAKESSLADKEVSTAEEAAEATATAEAEPSTVPKIIELTEDAARTTGKPVASTTEKGETMAEMRTEPTDEIPAEKLETEEPFPGANVIEQTVKTSEYEVAGSTEETEALKTEISETEEPEMVEIKKVEPAKATTIADEASKPAENVTLPAETVIYSSTKATEINETDITGEKTTPKTIETTVIQESDTLTPIASSEKTPAPTTPTTSEAVTDGFDRENVTDMPTKGYKMEDGTTDYPSYGQTVVEDDFLIDENACIYEGRIYQSAEQIPREDACEFCFCFRGDIICLQQSCPPPARNCNETRIPGFCCPRYECPVYITARNLSILQRRKGGATPYRIMQKRIDKREIRTVEVQGCQVNGTFYELGKTVTSTSGPCLHCVCQQDGLMHCDPQRCKPEPPLMLKMNKSFFSTR